MKKAFAPPTPEAVAAYAREIGYDKLAADPGRFCDYYETCGWRTNHGPMKNWQAAVRNWRRMDAERGIPGATGIPAARAEAEERRREAEARMREAVGRLAREWLAADDWARDPTPVTLGGRILRGPDDPEDEKRRIETKVRDCWGAAGARAFREALDAARRGNGPTIPGGAE